MADTLEEIYKATLTESSFNASGEATVLTTDSNTRYAIKDVQVKQVSSSINVNADLMVNDVPVANVTNSVTGSEIVGVSSTVKLKTSTFPLDYEDVYFGYIPNSSPTVIDKKRKAFVNNIEDTGLDLLLIMVQQSKGLIVMILIWLIIKYIIMWLFVLHLMEIQVHN